MAYNSNNRSERLLQGRRFTTDELTLTQEAFTDVFDLGAGEIFTDDGLIPTGSSQLPYSGSTQDGGIVSGSVVNPSIGTDVAVLKYWYRHKLKPAKNGNREVYYFTQSEPTSLEDTVASDQLIETDQQTNFVSPKYIIATDSPNTTEGLQPGYKIQVFKSTAASADLIGEDASSPSTYVFDYKTGILTWNDGSAPASNQYVYITVYQYVGRTLRSQIDDGSIGGSGGAGFPFIGSAQITGSLLVSGSGTVSTTIGSSLVTQDLTVQGRILDSQSLAFWGAVGDGVTNDTLAIQTALNSNTSSAQIKSNEIEKLTGGTVIYGEPGKTYLIGDTITVPTNVRFDLNQSRIYVTGSHDAVRLKPWSRLENGTIIISESLDYTDKSAILLLARQEDADTPADVFFPSIRRLYETTAGISNMNLRGPGLIPNFLIYGDTYGPVDAKLTGNAILLKAESNEYDSGPNINATKFHDFEINGFGYGIHIESINSYGVGGAPYISNNQFSNFGLKNNAYGIYIYNSQTPDTQISESAGFGSGDKAGALASSNVFSNFWYNPVQATNGSLHAIVNYGEKNLFDNFFLIDHKNAFTGSVADGGSPFKTSSPQFFSPSSGNRLNDAINKSPDATDEEIDFVPAAIVDLNPQGGNVYNGEFSLTHVQDRSYTGFNKYNSTRFDEFFMASPIDHGVTLPPYHLKGLPVGDQNDYLAFAYERGFGISQSRYPDSATGSRYDDISQGISTVFEPYGNGFVRYNSVTESVELTISFPQEEFNSYIREYARLGDDEYYNRSDNRFFKGLTVRFKEQKDFTNDSVSDYYQTPEHVKISVIQNNKSGTSPTEYTIYEYNENKTLFLGNVGKKAFESPSAGGYWDVKVMFSSSTAQDNPVVLERISCWLGTDDNKAYIKRSDDYYYGGLEFKPVYGRNADGTVDKGNVLREAILTAGDVSIGGFSSVSSSLSRALLGGGIVQLSNISQSNDISYEERVNKLIVYASASDSFLVNSSNLSTTVFQTEPDGTTTTNLLSGSDYRFVLLPFINSTYTRKASTVGGPEYLVSSSNFNVTASIQLSGQTAVGRIEIVEQNEPLYPGQILIFPTQSLGATKPDGTDLKVLLHDGWSDRRSWHVIGDKSLDVGEFGATGDGVTDDSDSIQEALDLAGEWEFSKSVNSEFLPTKSFTLSNGIEIDYQSTSAGASVKFPPSKTFLIGKTIHIPKSVTVDLNGSRLYITGSYDGVTLKGNSYINNGYIDISSSTDYRGKAAIKVGFDESLQGAIYGANNWWNVLGTFFAGGEKLILRGPGPRETNAAAKTPTFLRESYDSGSNGYGIYIDNKIPDGFDFRSVSDGSTTKQWDAGIGYAKFENIKLETFNDAIRLEVSCSKHEFDMATMSIDLANVEGVGDGGYLQYGGGINDVSSNLFTFRIDGRGNQASSDKTVIGYFSVTGSSNFTDGLSPSTQEESDNIAQYFIYNDGSTFYTNDGTELPSTVEGYGQALVNKINSVYNSGSDSLNSSWVGLLSASYENTIPSGSITIHLKKYYQNIGVKGNNYKFQFLSGSITDNLPPEIHTAISPSNGFTTFVNMFNNNNIFKDIGIIHSRRGVAMLTPGKEQFELSASLYGFESTLQQSQNIFDNVMMQASPIFDNGFVIQSGRANRINGSLWDWYDVYQGTGSDAFNPTSSNYSNQLIYHLGLEENEPPQIVIDQTSDGNLIYGGVLSSLIYENSALQNKNIIQGLNRGSVETSYSEKLPLHYSYRPQGDQNDFFANLASKYGSYITYSSGFDQQFDSENSSKANMFIADTTKDTILLNMTSSNFTASFDIDVFSIAEEITDSTVDRSDFLASLRTVGISFTPLNNIPTSQFPVLVPRYVKIEAVSGSSSTILIEKKNNTSDSVFYQKQFGFAAVGAYALGNRPDALKFRFTIGGSDMAKPDSSLLGLDESLIEKQIRINRVFASFGTLGNAFVKSSGDRLVGKYSIVSSSTDPGIISADNIKVSVLDFGAQRFFSEEETPAFVTASSRNAGTSTSYAYIQKAIDYVSSQGGGTVYVPKGIYPTQDPIQLKDNVTLEGEGESSRIYNVYFRNSIVRSPVVSLGWMDEIEFRDCKRYPFEDITAGDRQIQITNTASNDGGATFNGLDFSVGDIVYVRSSPNPYTVDETYIEGAEYLDGRKVISITPTAPSGALIELDRSIEQDITFRTDEFTTDQIIPFSDRLPGPSKTFVAKVSGKFGKFDRYTIQNAGIKNIRLSSKFGYGVVRTSAYECSITDTHIDAREGITTNLMGYSIFDNITLSEIGDKIIESNVGSSNNIYSNIRGIRDDANKNAISNGSTQIVRLNESETLRDSYFESSVTNGSAYTTNGFLEVLGGNNTIDNVKFRGFVDNYAIRYGKSKNIFSNNTFEKFSPADTGSTVISDGLPELAKLFEYNSSVGLELIEDIPNRPASASVSFDIFEYGTGTTSSVDVTNFYFRIDARQDNANAVDAVFYTTSSTNLDLGSYDGERFGRRNNPVTPPTEPPYNVNNLPAYYISESFSDVKQYGQLLAEKINYAFLGSDCHFESVFPESDGGRGTNILSASFDPTIGDSGSLFLTFVIGNNIDGTGSLSQDNVLGIKGNDAKIEAGSGSYNQGPVLTTGRVYWPESGLQYVNPQGGFTNSGQLIPTASVGVLSIDSSSAPNFNNAVFNVIDANGKNHEEFLSSFSVGDSIDFYNFTRQKNPLQAESVFRSSSFNVTNPSNQITSSGFMSFNGTGSSDITSASITIEVGDLSSNEFYPDGNKVDFILDSTFDDKFGRFINLAIGDSFRIFSASLDPINGIYLPHTASYLDFTITTLSGSVTGSNNEVQIINYTGTTTNVTESGASNLVFNTNDNFTFIENPAIKTTLSPNGVRLNIESEPYRGTAEEGTIAWYWFSGSSFPLNVDVDLTGSSDQVQNKLMANLVNTLPDSNIIQNNNVRFLTTRFGRPALLLRGRKNIVSQNSFELQNNTVFRIQNDFNTISFNKISGSNSLSLNDDFDYNNNLFMFNKNESDLSSNLIESPITFTKNIVGNTGFTNGINVTSSIEIKGSGTTSGTTSFLVKNSGNDELLKVTDDGTLSITGISDVSQSIADAASSGGGGGTLQDILNSNNTATESINLKGDINLDGDLNVDHYIESRNSASIDKIQIQSEGGTSVVFTIPTPASIPIQSVVIGQNTMKDAVDSGTQNVVIGRNSQQYASGSHANVSIGFSTLQYISSSINNVAIGQLAGYENGKYLSGSNNTFLGYNASYGNNTDIENSTALGANVTLTDSNTVILGNNASVGIRTTSPSKELEVVGDIAITDFPSVSASLATIGEGSGFPFIGKAEITGSLEVSGSIIADSITGSLLGTATTASYVTLSQTASYVETAQTASYVTLSQTASYVETAQTASYVTLAQTASYVENAQTASYVNPLNQNVIITGSLTISGSSTLTNIGPFVNSGSISVNGSVSVDTDITASGDISIQGFPSVSSSLATALTSVPSILHLTTGNDPKDFNKGTTSTTFGDILEVSWSVNLIETNLDFYVWDGADGIVTQPSRIFVTEDGYYRITTMASYETTLGTDRIALKQSLRVDGTTYVSGSDYGSYARNFTSANPNLKSSSTHLTTIVYLQSGQYIESILQGVGLDGEAFLKENESLFTIEKL